MTNGGAELVDWFSRWWMRQGLGWGLPTRPRWLSALLFSPRQPSLVTMGGASLYSVWSTENLIIQANVAFPFSSVFTHKNLFLPIPIVAEPWRYSYFEVFPYCLSKGETKGRVIESCITHFPLTIDELVPLRGLFLCELCLSEYLYGEKRCTQ